jgi:hypothetical protein
VEKEEVMGGWRYGWLGGFVCITLIAATGCKRTTVVVTAVVRDGTAAADTKPSAEAVFPADAGGDLLAKQLSPPDEAGRPDQVRDRPPLPTVPTSLEVPSEPLLPPPAPGIVPGLPEPVEHQQPRPHLVTEETPDSLPERVDLPEPRPLQVGARTRAEGPDPNQIPPLPVLASPIPDRASLDAPNAPLSLAAARPATKVPVPFTRVSVPDPLGRRRTLPRPLTPESGEPVVRNPQPPKL